MGCPLKDTQGKNHKIAVRMDVAIDGNALQFALHLENGGDCKVREVLYPLIGGLAKFGPPGKPADGVLWVPTTTPLAKKIDPSFGSEHFAYPSQMNMSFTCIQNEAAGKSLYFASHDKIARYKSYFFDRHVQATSKTSLPAFSIVLSPRRAKRSTARPWSCGWSTATGGRRARCTEPGSKRPLAFASPRECWIRRESFFQMTMFKLPEGTICYRFKDIPQWAKDAKDHGVNCAA